MNHKELKIGNYVNSGNGLYTIAAISIEGVEALQSHDSLISASSVILKSIPIDHNWLVNFGFEQTSKFGGNGYKKGNFILFHVVENIRNGEMFYELEYTPPQYSFDKRGHVRSNIKYIHQLQNLYFSLTDEELLII